MTPEMEAKIDAARGRRERERAALQSQVDVLAGRRDAFGNPITRRPRVDPKRAAARASREKYSAKRARQITRGQKCTRCQRKMAIKRRDGYVLHRARGLCIGCVGREHYQVRSVVLDRCGTCDKAMRPPGVKARDAEPGLVARATRRKCRSCATGRAIVPRAFQPERCVDCQYLLRKRGEPKSPDTRRSGSQGRCTSCYNRARRQP